MQVTIDLPQEFKKFDKNFLQKHLGQILFELDLLKDYYEAKSADDSRFSDL